MKNNFNAIRLPLCAQTCLQLDDKNLPLGINFQCNPSLKASPRPPPSLCSIFCLSISTGRRASMGLCGGAEPDVGPGPGLLLPAMRQPRHLGAPRHALPHHHGRNRRLPVVRLLCTLPAHFWLAAGSAAEGLRPAAGTTTLSARRSSSRPGSTSSTGQALPAACLCSPGSALLRTCRQWVRFVAGANPFGTFWGATCTTSPTVRTSCHTQFGSGRPKPQAGRAFFPFSARDHLDESGSTAGSIPHRPMLLPSNDV